MDRCEVGIDGIEAQSPTDVSHDRRKGRYSPMNLIKVCSQGFFQSRGDGSMPPSGDTKSITYFLTNLTLLDLYYVPDKCVKMNSEIFSAMRRGNREFLVKMKSYKTPMSCVRNEKEDSILHLAAASGHVELVKGIVSEWPCLLLLENSMNQIPLHVAARAGHLGVVEALVASITFFSAQESKEDGGNRLNPYVLKDMNGDTPLHLALKDLHEKKESLLTKHRPPQFSDLIKQLQRIRCCSVSDASSARLIETAVCLVNANQDAFYLANNDKVSPMYLAVLAGNISLVNAMLNRSGYNVKEDISNLASQLEDRKLLLHAALKAKNIDVLDAILKEYSSLVKERDEEGRTCLVNERDKEGQTSLSVGASVGFKEGVCKVLDRTTLSIFECDKDGSYPIHMAVEKGHEDVVLELLKRFPDSVEQVNKQGQNILHIAAKSGKPIFYLMRYISKLDIKNHLIEEQDVDGNTPLHLATINWRPRTVWALTNPSSTTTKVLNIQNKGGSRALEIADSRLQHNYVLRERMTLMVLLSVYKPKALSWIPTSGMTLRSKLKKGPSDSDEFNNRVNALLLVAALVGTMTFAAGFTMPGGFNSSAPKSGMAILVDDVSLSRFLLPDALAMYSSVVAIIALIWAQLGDEELSHKALHLALPSLFVALYSMSWAFFFGVLATIKHNSSLTVPFGIIFSTLMFVMLALLTPYVIPQIPGIPLIDSMTGQYLFILLGFVNEDDDEKHPTSSFVVKKAESVGSSSSGVQVEKSKEV